MNLPPHDERPASAPHPGFEPTPAAQVPPPPGPPGGWAVAAGRGLAWWTEGWRLFVAAPWAWIGITILFVLLVFGLWLIPLVGHLASGLLYPVFGAGLLLGARAVDRGQPLVMGHLFEPFQHRWGPLVISGLIYFAGWFLIWLVAFLVISATVGMATLSMLLARGPESFDWSTLAMLGGGAFLVFLLLLVLMSMPLIMAYWFAPALIVFRGDEPVLAMKSSLAASLRNVPPLVVYSLLGIAFSMAATLLLGLGWFVLLPVFVASVYASYKDIFGTPA